MPRYSNWNFNFYVKDNKEKLKVSDEDKLYFKDIEIKLKKYIDDLNPYKGKFTDKHNNTVRWFEYTISLTEHYITKFLRKEYENNDIKKPDRKFINPDLHEGIDLIYKNKNELSKHVASKFIKNKESVLVKMISSSKYSLIFALDMIEKGKFEISLISQMKGVDYDNFNGHIIKFHPNGDRN
jgi:hypothetical protein